MGRITRLMVATLGLLALSACSHHPHNGPLAYVPADTPYVAAVLKPLDGDAETAMLARANLQLPTQVATLRSLATRLHAEHKDDVANLVDAIADELNGRTVQQFAKHEGLDLHGRSVVFGLGLSPVARMDLSDPARFAAFIKRLEKAYGHDFQHAKAGKLDYRYALLGKAPLEVVLAIQGKQAVLALLPSHPEPDMLDQALGLKRPAHSLADSGRLRKLASQRGYLPYLVGYVDVTRLPALLTGPSDPLLKTLLMDAAAHGSDKSWPLPDTCRPDLDRLAARTPLLSFGYSKLDKDEIDQRVELDTAPDISAAFKGIKASVPGLGGGLSGPLDLAVALPVKELHTFLQAQAQAVAAKPFTCPALAGLNRGFAAMGPNLAKLGMPGIADLRGMRVSVDQLEQGSKAGFQGRVLIASTHPDALLALAQSVLKPLASLDVKTDGKPVPLPAQAAQALHQPAWVAMTANALALGIGPGQDARLGDMLKGQGGDAGDLMRMHVDFATYMKWVLSHMDDTSKQVASGHPAQAAKLQAELKRLQQQVQAQGASIRDMGGQVRMTGTGLVFESRVTFK